jgi:hypothetical protein
MIGGGLRPEVALGSLKGGPRDIEGGITLLRSGGTGSNATDWLLTEIALDLVLPLGCSMSKGNTAAYEEAHRPGAFSCSSSQQENKVGCVTCT